MHDKQIKTVQSMLSLYIVYLMQIITSNYIQNQYMSDTSLPYATNDISKLQN